jgi:hypothetical protein
MVLLAARAYSAEVDYAPRVWNPPSSYPATLRDVASRLPANTPAKEPDLITYAHEAAHFLCKGGHGCHGIYVGHGVRVYIPTPPLVTAQVFAAVPAEHRGTIYNTYLQQGRSPYWSTQPLMILDEWNAYLIGCRTRAELGVKERGETITHCVTFARYSKVLYDMAKDCDDYAVTDLRNFCRNQLDRCREVVPDWDSLCDVRFD